MPSSKSVDAPSEADLNIPQPGEDSTERKRVLNVLAQRRYRQRRKEHLRKLEAQAKLCDSHERESRNIDMACTTTQKPPASNEDQNIAIDFGEFNDFNMEIQNMTELDENIFIPANLGQSASIQSETILATPAPPFKAFLSFNNNSEPGTFVSNMNPESFWIDQSCVSMMPLIANSPISSVAPSWSENQISPFSRSPPRSSDPSTPTTSSSGNELQYSFPDEANLEVLELSVLRGASAIAKRLNIDELIWSLTSTSPFADPQFIPASFDHLPNNLRPTKVQTMYPHHPLVDLLPWPSVRDKLITIMSQPIESRPKPAASPTALLDFVYDFEDSAEGVRIWGDDPYSEHGWEVGEQLFKRWWWIFNGDIIRRSNELRSRRGAPMLGQGTIIGELV